MKNLIITALLLFCVNANAWPQSQPLPQSHCAVHNPWGFPQTTGFSTICRQGYFVGYDDSSKIPKFVTYELTPNHTLGCVVRTNAFVADQSIQGGATPEDYNGTNYDRGHQAPDGDLDWDTQTEHESFLMTNMAPQAGSFNRGIWKLLETSVRGWALQLNQPFVIYVGTLYSSKDKKIGKGVVVPHGFYKIVINEKTSEFSAWEFPHISPYPSLGNDLTKFRVTFDKIQKDSGIIFILPKNAKELPVGKEWPIDFGKLTKSKQTTCKIK